MNSVFHLLSRGESRLCGLRAAKFRLEEDGVASLHLQLRQKAPVPQVSGRSHLSGPQWAPLYTEAFRLDISKGPSQAYMIFLDSKILETTCSSGPVTTAQVKRHSGWCQGLGMVGTTQHLGKSLADRGQIA